MSVLRRLRPDGLAARFALLLAAALIVANLVALALLSFERTRLDRAAHVEREAERIVSLVPVIEAAAPAARRAIAQNASTRFSRLSVGPRPAVDATQEASRSADLTQVLTEALAGRAVRATISTRPDRDGRDGRSGRETIAASVALAGPEGGPAQWLNVVSIGGGRLGPPGRDGGVFLRVLGLSLLSVLGVALLYVRRLTRPLGDLARAARAAGRGDRSVRVAEDGPREMRHAAAAFNEMQGRIARFDAERMRTLAAVGHDLRTPITSLRIRAELLDETDAVPMIRTLDEMTVMANGLVAYARGAGHPAGASGRDVRTFRARRREPQRADRRRRPRPVDRAVRRRRAWRLRPAGEPRRAGPARDGPAAGPAGAVTPQRSRSTRRIPSACIRWSIEPIAGPWRRPFRRNRDFI